jgi:translation initiation factor 2 beta subunit (eIF-2beta)/eIF-5
MAGLWINNDGSTTPIRSSQDVAEALDNDPETANFVAEETAREIEEEK